MEERTNEVIISEIEKIINKVRPYLNSEGGDTKLGGIDTEEEWTRIKEISHPAFPLHRSPLGQQRIPCWR